MKRHAPATARNRDPILAVLRQFVPDGARVLEVASGTGEHAVYFAAQLPGVTWQPSDPDPQALASIEAHRADADNERVLAPITLDATRPFSQAVGEASFDVLVCINMIHIAPPQAMVGLVNGAAQVLESGGRLITYGPYKRGGVHTAPSNEAFEGWLKDQDPSYGVRDLETLTELCENQKFRRLDVRPMPANNFTVVFEKGP